MILSPATSQTCCYMMTTFIVSDTLSLNAEQILTLDFMRQEKIIFIQDTDQHHIFLNAPMLPFWIQMKFGLHCHALCKKIASRTDMVWGLSWWNSLHINHSQNYSLILIRNSTSEMDHDQKLELLGNSHQSCQMYPVKNTVMIIWSNTFWWTWKKIADKHRGMRHDIMERHNKNTNRKQLLNLTVPLQELLLVTETLTW